MFGSLMANFTIAQAMGFVAMGLSIVVALQKNDKKLLLWAAIAISFWSLHFFLLEQYAAAATNVLVVVRCLITLRWTGAVVGIPSSILIGGVGFLTYVSPINLLPIIASVVGSICTTMMRGWMMRVGLLIVTLLWAVHNWLVGSWAGALMETINVILFTFTIYRIVKQKSLT